jgi:HSP20 family molecular chaperone IbpA
MSDHWWKRKKHTDTWFNDIFTESDKTEKMIDDIINDAFETPTEKEKARKHYTHQFGQPEPETDNTDQDTHEPLIDIIQEGTDIIIIAHLPGIEKDNIEIHSTEDKTTINVDAPQLKYHKQLNLPTKINPKTSTAAYKNGTLQIHLKKQIGQRLYIK